MQNCGYYMNQNTRCGGQDTFGRNCCEKIEDTAPCLPLKERSLAMSYVPWQQWKNIYNMSNAFKRGTAFAELDKPFFGKGGCN